MHPSDFKARIDFRHPLIPREGLSFPKFERLLVAQDLNEILPLVHEIEKATKDGAYAVGFLAYEAAPAFDDALSVREGDGPLAVFGLAGQAHGNGKMERDAFSFGRWQAAWARKDHGNAIETILEAIRAGETYQANLTFPLSTGFEGSIEACYQHLLKSQDADYCGMFSGPDFSVLSASPELFFERSGERLRTRPMKGTRRRGLTLEDDLARSSELTTSGKDRAENLMIVDLLRNDLGRIALPGSVSVDGLFDIERYPTVWQMTSTISARVAPKTKLADILRALFPCGSVTGAPKVSTMRLLSQLESTPRGPYCGAFGVVLPGGDCVFNVPIRTLMLSEGNTRATYPVGSGVVADSLADHEYDECLLKARILERDPAEPFYLFETLGWSGDEGFRNLRQHLDRLGDSCRYFGFPFEEESIKDVLEKQAGDWSRPMRVRLMLNQYGEPSIKAEPLLPFSGPIRLKWAEEAVDASDRFLYHKTSRREVYDRERARLGQADDAVLFNQRGEVTETTIANIAFLIDGRWVTPPISSGLLPGVLRGKLLESGELTERVISIAEARQAADMRVLSALRGQVPAHWMG